MSIFTLFHDKSYVWLSLTLITYFAGWFVCYKLYFKILQAQMPLRTIPAILITVGYVCCRPFIPAGIFVILLQVLVIIVLSLFGRLGFFRCVYAVLICSFLSYSGNILIESVLFCSNPKFFSFFFDTPQGNIAGSMIEVFFPSLALIILSKYSLRLPIKDNSEPYDYIDFVLQGIFACMLYLASYSTVSIYSSFRNEPKNISSVLIFAWVATAGIIGGNIFILYVMAKWVKRLKKHRQRDKDKILRLKEENLKLNRDKEDLSILYEQVKSRTIDSQEAIDIAQNIIERLQNSIFKRQEIYTENINESSDTDSVNIHLTNREKQVLQLVVRGLYNKQIADELGIGKGRVDNIVNRIIAKAKVSGKVQLVIFAIKNKLINIDDIEIDFIKDENKDNNSEDDNDDN